MEKKGRYWKWKVENQLILIFFHFFLRTFEMERLMAKFLLRISDRGKQYEVFPDTGLEAWQERQDYWITDPPKPKSSSTGHNNISDWEATLTPSTYGQKFYFSLHNRYLTDV